MIDEAWLAEATYEAIRSVSTKEEMAKIIHQLLSCEHATDHVKTIAIRMAMIYSAEEGHS